MRYLFKIISALISVRANKSALLWMAASIFLIAACHKNNSPKLPTTMTADSLIYNTATGNFTPNSTISGSVNAPLGIRLIYYYLVRNGTTDLLVYMDTSTAESRKSLSFSIPSSSFKNMNLSAITGIKVMVKLSDNSTFEGFVKITPFTPPLPEIKNFPDTLKPNLSGGNTKVNGDVSSESGLEKIIIEDDYQGDYVGVDSITNLKDTKDYALNYDYSYRKNATHLKIIAVDIYGLSTAFVITMPVLPYDVYKNITMMAQGTSSTASTNCFFLDDGSLTGTCDISGHEPQLDFLTYCNSSFAMYFYSPTNTGNVAKNFKCNGDKWAPNPADMKATRFRVLEPGSSETDAIYAAYNANNIPKLDDDFFAGISEPSASSSKYIADESQAGSSVFNTTKDYLIWVRIPDGSSFKNGLIKVNSVNAVTESGSQGLSTINFDLMLQK